MFKIVLVAVFAFTSASCSFLNILETQRDYNEDYLEKDFICLVDVEMMREKDGFKTGGHLTKDYSPELWNSFWVKWVLSMNSNDLSKTFEGYDGISGHSLALYAMKYREESGLPKLYALDEASNTVLSDIYRKLGDSVTSSCQLINFDSPICTVGPGDYGPNPRRLPPRCGIAK